MGIDRGDTDDAAFAHIDELCELASCPNISVKVRSDLFQRAVSAPDAAPASEAPLRCVRAEAPFLGLGLDTAAVQLSGLRESFHRRASLAHGERPRLDHGPGAMRVARLADVIGREVAL
jgi:hypothetical protein